MSSGLGGANRRGGQLARLFRLTNGRAVVCTSNIFSARSKMRLEVNAFKTIVSPLC